MRLVAVVGSRRLPRSFVTLVEKVVQYLVLQGYQVASGGALGADALVLVSLIRQSAISSGYIFSAWDRISGFPRFLRTRVSYFIATGGRVAWGPVSPHSTRSQVLAGIFGRSKRLVSSSRAVVAFLFGPSRGTHFTIRQAILKRRPVFAFLCGGEAGLPSFPGGKWVEVTASTPLKGSFHWVSN